MSSCETHQPHGIVNKVSLVLLLVLAAPSTATILRLSDMLRHASSRVERNSFSRDVVVKLKPIANFKDKDYYGTWVFVYFRSEAYLLAKVAKASARLGTQWHSWHSWHSSRSLPDSMLL